MQEIIECDIYSIAARKYASGKIGAKEYYDTLWKEAEAEVEQLIAEVEKK